MAEAIATSKAAGANQPLKWLTVPMHWFASAFAWFCTIFTFDTDEEELQYTEEPHATRRREILLKHPEIKKLMGYDPSITYVISAEIVVQLFVAWLVQDASWTTVFVLAYCLGAMLNQSLSVGLHELGHNLAFGHRNSWLNRALGIFCNVPLIVPLAITFKKYHADHHRYLGENQLDTDVPTRLDIWFFRNPLTKVFWMVLHPLFYAVRPLMKASKPFSGWEIFNIVFQLSVDYTIYAVFGAKALMYLLAGMYFGMSLHPLAAHFISEHYFLVGGQPTHSYYGPFNRVIFNAGYHNEHHDFPYVPYSRLPEVRRLAPEYYDCLPHHSSWMKVLWDFIFLPNIAPHSRGKGYNHNNNVDSCRNSRTEGKMQ
ncbi:sphingolipid delta(4)-desaturase DES1-like [Littorina saxatilis]|uniref:sphingolipid delta(4)-desaturase DES1-like n=1 Tax=Littorina saxatilis TaxID=31220 RepID=UPI0038B56682